MALKMVRHFRSFTADHLDEDGGDGESNPLTDFIASDPELLDSAKNGKPFSKAGVKKIRAFLLSNDEFKEVMLSSFADGAGDDCFSKFTDAQKDKVFKIMVDNMPI